MWSIARSVVVPAPLLGIALRELDLVVGGQPRQTFRAVSRRATIGVVRGMSLWQSLHYGVAFRPKFFLMENVMENVRGLMSAAIRRRR